MAEYIEREAVLRRMQKIATEAWKMRIKANVETVWNEAQDVLRFFPAADVRPVVRGKWKKVGTQMHLNLDNAREQYRELGYPHRNIECLKCSNCRKVSMVDESIRYEFCPHCGADMREES